MQILNLSQVSFEDFKERGAKGVIRKTLVSEKNGSKFFRLRYYKLEKGGQTPFDIHDYEHVLIVTKGSGYLLTLINGVPSMRKLTEGDVVYISSREPHQLINMDQETFEFYCFGTSQSLYVD